MIGLRGRHHSQKVVLSRYPSFKDRRRFVVADSQFGGRMVITRFVFRLAVFSIGVLLLAFTLAAQTSRGTVTGLVTDAQQAVVASAKVDLTALATNVTRRTQTNESGLYRFDSVDPGLYKLTVQSAGFRTAVAGQFTVGAAQVATQ